jgi:hypothetical protein
MIMGTRVANHHEPAARARPALAGAAGSCRPAYTLLEVLLAAAIAVLLLAALYAAVDMQLRHAESGRAVVQQSLLARGVLNRIADDITSSVGPTDPSRYRTSGGKGSGGTPGSGQSGSGTGTGSTSPSGSSGSGTSGSGASSGSSGTVSTSGNSTPPSPFFLQGDSGSLTIYTSRVPREVLISPEMAALTNAPPVASDLRRICYWLAGDGTLGLARQELLMVTSDDAQQAPTDVGDEASWVMASEVQSLTLSYWDGTNWQESWDGNTPGSDGVTPIGPPIAVAVVIGMVPPGTSSMAGSPQLKVYRHVVEIPTANGAMQQATGSNGSTQQTSSYSGQ